MIRRVRELIALSLLACGSAKPPPAGPRPLDPARIARDVHAQLVEMAELAHRTRAACPAMASELKGLFARMRATVDEARRAVQDPELAKQLTTELRRYDETDRALPDAIAADLVTCKDDPAVRDVMATMPTLPDGAAPRE